MTQFKANSRKIKSMPINPPPEEPDASPLVFVNNVEDALFVLIEPAEFSSDTDEAGTGVVRTGVRGTGVVTDEDEKVPAP